MSDPPQPDEETRAFIERQQERAYRKLSLAMGLGPDPRASYERLTRRQMALEPAAGVPTPFEDPGQYPVIAGTIDDLQATVVELGGQAIVPRPIAATLPSGEVDAMVLVAPRSRVPVMFFEQGLFHYLYDFAELIAWAAPPLPPEVLASDAALAAMPHRYTMPFQASDYFVGTLNAYVLSGSPLDTPTPIPPAPHNEPLAGLLRGLMQRFVMAHELAHVKFGHLDGEPTSEQEHEADEKGMALVALQTQLAGSWGIGFWASQLVLGALNILYRSIAVVQFGAAKVRWISTTHPQPVERQERLRAAWSRPDLPPLGVAAAAELCGMSDALLQRLWEMAMFVVYQSHLGGARPSPIWNGLLDHTFRAQTPDPDPQPQDS